MFGMKETPRIDKTFEDLEREIWALETKLSYHIKDTSPLVECADCHCLLAQRESNVVDKIVATRRVRSDFAWRDEDYVKKVYKCGRCRTTPIEIHFTI